jgi:HK97 family phage portal protein
LGKIARYLYNKIQKRAMEDPRFWALGGGDESSSGIVVDRESVVSISSVYAALNLLCSTIGSLPLETYEYTDNGRQKARDFELYELLHDLPNPLMTSFEWRRAMMCNYFIGGRAYSLIKWDNKGRRLALLPIPFWRMRERYPAPGVRVYDLYPPTGGVVTYNDYEVLRIENIGYMQGNAFSPLFVGKDIFGLAKAAEEFGGRFFSTGANASGILKHPEKLTQETVDRLRRNFHDKYQGVFKSHEIIVLEEGMEFVRTAISPEESQFIDTRKFQVTEVARFFNVPPHLIMDLERSTYSNIEEQNINFVVYTLRPLFVMWEQEIKRTLLTPQERKLYYAEFNADGLLRGNSTTRASVFQIMKQNGVMNINEWREKENMNGIGEYGDIYFMPLNFAPIDKVVEGNPQEQQQQTALNNLAEILTRNITPYKRREIPENEGEIPPNMRKLSAYQRRSVTNRNKITKDFNAKISKKGQKIIDFEAEEVSKIAKKHLKNGENVGEFERELREFYDKLPENIRESLNTTFTALALAVFNEAAREIDFDGTWDEQMSAFVEKYMDAYIARHIASSKAQIATIVKTPVDNGRTLEDEVEERLDEWKEKRADKIGLNEAVRLAGAIARATYKAGGVRYIMWINTGSKSCPYCEEMDGKVVGIDKNFLYPGDTAGGDMEVSSNMGHPPLHQGCICTIVSN